MFPLVQYRIDLRMKGSELSLNCIGIAFLHYLTVRHSKEAMKAGMRTWERDGVSYLLCLPPKKLSFYIQTLPPRIRHSFDWCNLGREDFRTNMIDLVYDVIMFLHFFEVGVLPILLPVPEDTKSRSSDQYLLCSV